MSVYPKYPVSEPVAIEDRIWPSRRIHQPPVWVPVDLRDGNQAFARPMNVETKIRYFQMLVDIGFKEIEVGFPAASCDEFNFVRRLIEEKRIPADVRIVVFTAARQDLIERTVASIAGVVRAVVHCYIATSDLHRQFVFGKSEEEIITMAVSGTRMIREAVVAAGLTERVGYEFSPEEFSDSRMDFIVRLADAVKAAWGACDRRDFIFNLPATVERRPPYEYADMIESFCRRCKERGQMTVSVHTHNDQGCAVAAAEMAVLAGADRVEGTLCGHGERTGNMDLITFALNLQSRGIAPGVDFSHLPEIVRFIESVSQIATYPRTPYTGELVFTAFSGTHQDAIRKGFRRRAEISECFECQWKMPYLHIDPADIGRSYDGLIRINSQSGKGGVAFILESVYGMEVPRELQAPLGRAVQRRAEETGRELSPSEILCIFEEEFAVTSAR